MNIIFLTLLSIASVVAFYKAVRWSLRVDRLQRDAISEADEIAAIRKFHETIDGTLALILKRGK